MTTVQRREYLVCKVCEQPIFFNQCSFNCPEDDSERTNKNTFIQIEETLTMKIGTKDYA